MLMLKIRELPSLMDETKEVQLQKLEYQLQLVTLADYISFLNLSTRVKHNLAAFLKRLFYSDPEDITAKPAIIEIFEITDSLHTSFYHTVDDENINLLGALSSSLKDNINGLTKQALCFITRSLECLCEQVYKQDLEVLGGFGEQYLLTVRSVVEMILAKIEKFGLNKNYISVLVFSQLAYSLRVVAPYKVSSDLNIPVVLVKKLRSMVEWTHTKEFADFLDNKPDDSTVSRINALIIKLLVDAAANDNLIAAAKEEAVKDVGSSDTVYDITRNIMFSSMLTNKQTRQVQEQIIRGYLHITIHMLLPEWVEDKTHFFNFDVFTEIWKLIGTYSSYERLDFIEFKQSIAILMKYSIASLTNSKIFGVEVMSRLCCDYFFGITSISTAEGDFAEIIKDIIYNIYYSKAVQYNSVTENFPKKAQESFDLLQSKGNELVTLYNEDSSIFVKEALKLGSLVENFTERLMHLFSLKGYHPYNRVLLTKDLTEQLTTSLIKFSFSPLFCMIVSTNITKIQEIIIESAEESNNNLSLYSDQITNYAAKIIELQSLINQHSKNNDLIAENFFRKISLISASHQYPKNLWESLYKESYSTDIKDIFTLNSKLIPILYLDSIDIQSMAYKTFPEKIVDVVTIIVDNLPTSIDFTLSTLKAKIKIASEEQMQVPWSSITPFKSLYITCHYLVSEVKEYVQKSSKLLLSHLISENSISNLNEEEMLSTEAVCNRNLARNY